MNFLGRLLRGATKQPLPMVDEDEGEDENEDENRHEENEDKNDDKENRNDHNDGRKTLEAN